MCMITFLPEGVPADEEAIYNGTIYNDDGHGFALIANDELIVRRGMDAMAMVELFMQWRQAHPAGPAMFHSRLATHGVTDKANTHPFYVGSDRRTVLVHNGIFSTIDTKGTSWSDTRVFAQSLLPSRRDMDVLTRGGRIRTQKWMGRYNKVAVITTNPRSKVSSFILNQDEGYWESDGSWYSGLDYLGPKYNYRSWGYGTGTYVSSEKGARDADEWWDAYSGRAITSGKAAVLGSSTKSDEEWEAYWTEYCAEHGQCKFCEAIGTIDKKSGVCAICVMCNDCNQPEKFCVCV